jgi:hypothetical protein
MTRQPAATRFAIENDPPASSDESLSSPDPVAEPSSRHSLAAGAAQRVAIFDFARVVATNSVADVFGDKVSGALVLKPFATLPLVGPPREETFANLVNPFRLRAEVADVALSVLPVPPRPSHD